MVDQSNNGQELTLKEFVEESIEAFERTHKELTEIDILVKQSVAEVERLADRNTRMSNYVRQLETNFDTVPREDIREGYEALINAQQRLFTMRGQLEKLQSDHRNLFRLHEFQRQALDMTEGLAELPTGTSRLRDQKNIIKVIQTEESARQSLVRRMHDGPASSLSNFILQAEICQRFFDVDPERAREELSALKQSAAATFSEVKGFIFDLRPMMLDDLGIAPTLRRYVESLQEKYDIAITMTTTGSARRLAEHVEVAIFRTVQELLNIARVHGQASEIRVMLDLEDDRINVVVEDNGGGFNQDDSAGSGAGRMPPGLPALRDRIALLDGDLIIRSNLGEGTRAEFSLLVEADQALLIEQ